MDDRFPSGRPFHTYAGKPGLLGPCLAAGIERKALAQSSIRRDGRFACRHRAGGAPGLRKTGPLNNNNRGNNNRRRSRGNNRPQGSGNGGGGAQLNRIDSRARGNAPQMLEKYRKLAHDAHLNGDRVTAEYYLQFADHYFRVIADTRVRQEEQRGGRADRWGENGEGGSRDDHEEAGEFSVEADFPAFDQPPVYTRRDREDRGNDRGAERAPERTNEQGGERGPERGQERAPERGNTYRRRDERPLRDDAFREAETRDEPSLGDGDTAGFGADQSDDGQTSREPASIYEPSENPFIRPSRVPRAGRPLREERRPRREDRDERAPVARSSEHNAEPVSVGLDPSLLPPAISATRRDSESAGDDATEATPRRRIRRKPADDAGEPLDILG